MVSNLDSKKLLVKLFSDRDSYDSSKGEVFDEEILEIENFSKEDIGELEKEGFFYMPNYISYFRETDSVENILASLSKNKRKKIKKGMKEMERFEIIKENEITTETFKKWYKLYKSCINEKGEKGILVINKDWVYNKRDYHQKLGIFLEENGKIIAGLLTRSLKETEFLPRRLSISFSTIHKDYKNLGLNDYLNLLLIEYAKDQGYDYITRGMDTNLYGKHLSIGIPIFKTALGYEIIPVKNKPKILIKFNNLNSFNEKIFFLSFSKDSNKLTGNLIFNNAEVENCHEYLKEFMKELRIFEWKENNLKLAKTLI